MSDLVNARVEAELKLPLTKAQVEESADRAADLMRELDENEEKFKLVKREWNADLKDIRLRIRKFLGEYREGARKTKVECVQVFDVKKKKTWYEYDGEVYSKRDLTDHELEKAKQQGLFGDGPDLPGVITDKEAN